MKLNLMLGGDAVRSGHLNIDPFATDGDSRKLKDQIFNLEYVADAGEVTEIVAHDVLDYVSRSKIDDTLDAWVSRLARGGSISISVIDVLQVSRGLTNNHITVDQANDMLHGMQSADWEYRRCAFTAKSLAEALTKRGLQITLSRVGNFRACVTARRS